MSAHDLDSRPGNVSVSAFHPGGPKSLKKTADGFVMTILSHQPTGSMALLGMRDGFVVPSYLGDNKPGSVKTLETYTVNEKTNTISYTKMKESPLSAAGIARPDPRGELSPLGENPAVVETYVLDLNRGTITDFTPAAAPTAARDRSLLDSRTNGVL